MKKDVSSEEKLLNLIRKKNPAEKKDNRPKDLTEAAASLRASVKGFSDWSQMFIRMSLILCLACLVYIGSQMFFFKETRDVSSLPSADIREDGPEETQVLPAAKPFSEYAEVISQRDIFESPFQKSQAWAQPGAQAQVPVAANLELAQNFKVVGIILDKDPKAVIEDIRNQRTLFLSYGDHLEGGTLEEIRDGKVIFLFNDQRVELVP